MKVLVREPIADAGVELLRQHFDVDVDGDSDLAETIGEYDAIVIRSATKLTAVPSPITGQMSVNGEMPSALMATISFEAETRPNTLVTAISKAPGTANCIAWGST